MRFVFDGLGNVQAAMPLGAAAEIRMREDGRWAWAVMRGRTVISCGASRWLDDVMEACVAEASGPPTGRWFLELPCGARITRPGRLSAEEVLLRHGYDRPRVAQAFLALSSRVDATADDVRGLIATMLDDGERARLGVPDLVERVGALSYWCADLALPCLGYVHPVHTAALSALLSPSAAALSVRIEVEVPEPGRVAPGLAAAH